MQSPKLSIRTIREANLPNDGTRRVPGLRLALLMVPHRKGNMNTSCQISRKLHVCRRIIDVSNTLQPRIARTTIVNEAEGGTQTGCGGRGPTDGMWQKGGIVEMRPQTRYEGRGPTDGISGRKHRRDVVQGATDGMWWKGATDGI